MSQVPRPHLDAFQWMLLALLAASLACSLPGRKVQTVSAPSPTPLPTNTPQPLPPTLVESSPPAGAEIPLNSPITLFFNQPMDQPSVEAALSAGDFGGSLFWANDSTVVFKPDTALPPEIELTLAINQAAKARNGLAMPRAVELTYRTAGYLRLTQRLPEDAAVEVDPSSAVVASFNRPVVPLGADPSGLPAAFTLTPAVSGRGEWTNTSTYIFYPEPALVGGQSYIVQVSPDLLSTDGSPLEVPVPWSFTTAVPALASVEPLDGAGSINLDAPVRLTFNQRMDAAGVQASFRLLDPDLQPVQGQAGWSEDFTTFTYTPTTLLRRNAFYTVQLDSTAPSAGGSPLGMGFQATWSTVPDLSVVAHSVAAGGVKDIYADLSIIFSAPVPYEGIEKYVRLSPELKNVNYFLEEDRRTLHIYGDYLPATEYLVAVESMISDVWGGPLRQPFQLDFRTGDYFPSLSYSMGLDNIFLTPDDAMIDMQVVNIPAVQFGMGSVSLVDYLSMIAPGGFELRQNYQPADARYWQAALSRQFNTIETVGVPVSPEGTPLSPGLYWLRAYTEQQIYSPPVYVVVSNVQLTFKVSLTDILVWAADMRSQAPVPGAVVTVYNEDGTPLAAGVTDGDGVFRSPIPSQTDPFRTRIAVLGRPGDDLFSLALSTWDSGLGLYEFNITQDYRIPGLRYYLYTDRPIYRPGQTVYFRVVAREALNGRYTLPTEISPINITINDGVGIRIAAFDLAFSAFGTAYAEYTLNPSAAPGYYGLQIGDQSLSFQVADYRKPEINLQVNFAGGSFVYGQNLPVQVEARYFFDAPAGNMPLYWSLSVTPDSFSLPGYQTGPFDRGWLNLFQYPGFFSGSVGYMLAQGDGRTDPDGRFALDLPTVVREELVNPAVRQRYTLEVTLTDESGLPVSARASTLVDPAGIYIGVQPDLWLGQAGQAGGYTVQVVDSSGTPAGMYALHAEFRKVIWIPQEVSVQRRLVVPAYRLEYTPVSSADFSTGADGLARLSFTPPEAGTYQLDLTGEGALTELLVWISGNAVSSWPNLPNQRLRLSSDRTAYQVGEIANVFVPNPYPVETIALLTIERGVIMRHQVLRLPPGGSQIPINLGAEDAPNVYASITLLGRNESGLPDFRQGYIDLEVAPVQQTLQIDLDVQPQRAGPGQEVTVTIVARDAQRNPVQGEFSISLVDLAALAIADPNAPDILPAFYGQQPLGVRTALTLAAYGRRLAIFAGGSGGGGDSLEAASVTRENFPDTAYWNATIVTGEDGRAQITLTLPDNLTTWQVDARGITVNSLVGQARAQIVATKELLVRPAVPRFMVVGDHVRLSAVVQNTTLTDLPVDVTLQTNGVTLDSGQAESQQINVPAGGRSRLTWWVTVQDVRTVDLLFTARAGELEDSIRPAGGQLPVLRYSALQAFATSGILEGAATQLELVSLPQSYAAAAGPADELRIEIAPSLVAAMLSTLKIRSDLGYGGAEQTASLFLPNLETYRLLQSLGVQTTEVQAKFEDELRKGLQNLLSTQRDDGGWSWWQDLESDPYISAYVLFALTQAQGAGMSLPPDSLTRAVNYLVASLTPPATLQEAWLLDRLAFIHYVLTEAGSPDIASLTALFEARAQLNPWAEALLALALDKVSPGSQYAITLFSDLQVAAQRSAAGAFWSESSRNPQNMHSTFSTTAMVIYALAQRDPAAPVLADAVRYLMVGRQASGNWSTSFDDGWALLAINRYIQGTGEFNAGFEFDVAVNGEQLASGQAGGDTRLNPVRTSLPAMRLYPAAPNALTIQRSDGPGRLYYTALLDVSQPVELVAPLNRGMTVTRAYFLHGQSCLLAGCSAIQQASVGQPLTVRLTLVVPQDAFYVRLEDYIPAGAEIRDTSLKTTQLSLDGFAQPGTPRYDPSRPYQDGWGAWFFGGPQIYADHVGWTARNLPAGTYELTYTLNLFQPGEYRVLPARAWQFYFPDVQGASAGSIFTIQP